MMSIRKILAAVIACAALMVASVMPGGTSNPVLQRAEAGCRVNQSVCCGWTGPCGATFTMPNANWVQIRGDASTCPQTQFDSGRTCGSDVPYVYCLSGGTDMGSYAIDNKHVVLNISTSPGSHLKVQVMWLWSYYDYIPPDYYNVYFMDQRKGLTGYEFILPSGYVSYPLDLSDYIIDYGPDVSCW
ncbi:MAG TPA: hypothetical protein VJ464_28295 [Blastocatellia bacterium]|nr:hypothetical protein [Blastocatellia bacterium]